MKKLFFCIDFCIKLTYNLIKSNCYLCSLRNYYLTDLWGSETVSFKLSLTFSKNYYLTDLWGSETFNFICNIVIARTTTSQICGVQKLPKIIPYSKILELLPHRFAGFRNINLAVSVLYNLNYYLTDLWGSETS